jgi:hypothetical protein
VGHREGQPDGGRDDQVEDAAHAPDGRVGLADPLTADEHREGPEVRAVEEGEQALGEEAGDEDVGHGQDVQPVGDGDGPDDQDVGEVCGDHHALAFPAVAERPGEEADQQVGQRVQRGRQCGQGGRAGERVDEDGHRHDGDERTGQRDDARSPVEPEVAVVAQPAPDAGGAVAAHRTESAG